MLALTHEATPQKPELKAADRVLQLLECCDEQLRRDLTRVAGGTLADKSEEDVLAALAVREENTMVARVTLQNMRQDRDKPIRAFGPDPGTGRSV